MRITRRQFIKYVSAAGAALGLTELQVQKLAEFLATAGPKPKVVWVNGQDCDGCSTSVIGLVDRDFNLIGNNSTPFDDAFPYDADHIDDVLIDIIDLQYHYLVQAAGGDLAVKHLKSFYPPYPLWPGNYTGDVANERAFVLVVQGAIPVDGPGNIGKRACSIGQHTTDTEELWFADVVRSLASNSIIAAGNGSAANPYVHAVLAVGTCASFGGVPALSSNYLYLKTGATPASSFLGSLYVDAAGVHHTYLVVNVPGCPANPDWFYGTAVRALGTLGIIPGLPTLNLDVLNREKAYYGNPIHAFCPLRRDYDAGVFATKRGEGGCLQMLGCKGLSTFSDCPTRGWNDSPAIHGRPIFCVIAGHPCMGCTEKGFPGKCEPFMKY